MDAQTYFERGVAHFGKGEYDAAIAAWKQAVVIEPGYPEADHNIGAAYGKLEQYAEALAAYKKAIDIKPAYAEAYSNMGAAYNELGQHAEAIAAYTNAIDIKPEFAGAYYTRAIARFLMRDFEKAWADVKQCQRLGFKVDPTFLAKLRKASGREE